MIKIPEVTSRVWQDLYAAASEFGKLEPWDLMDDDEIFGIRDPVAGEMGYACILGALGQVFALCLYRGAGGFDFHQRSQKGEVDWDGGELIGEQNALMAEFADREFLEKTDLEVIRNLKLHFRGANAWPCFRSYLPGYAPWHLTEAEAIFLTFALRCSCDAIQRVDEAELDLLSRPGQVFCYYPKGKGNSTGWEFDTRWEPIPIYRPDPPPPLGLDDGRLSQIRSRSLKKDSAWEADFNFLPVHVTDKERPYFPVSALVVHQATGFVFNAKVENAIPRHQALADAILGSIEKSGFIPDEIHVRNARIASSLSPLGKILGVKIEAKNYLGAVQEAKRGLDGFLKEPGKKPVKDFRPLKLDTRVLEKMTFNLSRKIKEFEPESLEEAEQYLKGLEEEGGLDTAPAPQNAWEVAQNLMYEAFEEENPRRRVDLARDALKISPDCADAYCLLAEETARNLEEATNLYQKAVEAGERALGKEFFEENSGHFWGMVESRPYMRARAQLATCLWRLGKQEDALQHYQEMLKLNPNDNQGIRYLLIARLGVMNRWHEVEELLSRKEYEDEAGLEWLLMKALAAFVKGGPSEDFVMALKEALKDNKHFPDYLLKKKSLPRRLPEHYRIGGEAEAMIATAQALPVWEKVPGALNWLAGEAAKLELPKVGRNDPCPCGSGKKYKKCCGR